MTARRRDHRPPAPSPGLSRAAAAHRGRPRSDRTAPLRLTPPTVCQRNGGAFRTNSTAPAAAYRATAGGGPTPAGHLRHQQLQLPRADQRAGAKIDQPEAAATRQSAPGARLMMCEAAADAEPAGNTPPFFIEIPREIRQRFWRGRPAFSSRPAKAIN